MGVAVHILGGIMVAARFSAGKILDVLDIFSKVHVAFYYLAAAAVLIIWMVIFFSQTRLLRNHPNAVCLRELHELFRTSDREKNQTEEIIKALTQSKNDLSMIFYLYCRLYKSFSSIKNYLNYKFFKRINKKRKPWRLCSFMALVIIITGVFGFYQLVGFTSIASAGAAKITIAILIPGILFALWAIILIRAMSRFNTYWLEFINMFKKVNKDCEKFFISQQPYFKEFSDKVFSELEPTVSTKQYIERIIAHTDFARISEDAAKVSEVKEKETVEVPSSPIPPANPAMPFQQSVQILKPHPESAAYIQAQNQMTQQMMQMMMQQTAQQSQLIHRALASQQALAQGVIQQNIMAMRVDAQGNYLDKMGNTVKKTVPDYLASIPPIPETKLPLSKKTDETEKAEAEKSENFLNGKPFPNTGSKNDEPSESKVEIKNILPEKEEKQPMTKAEAARSKILTTAFMSLSPKVKTNPKTKPSKNAEIIIYTPKRNNTNIEDRLGQFFSAKVYKYKKGEWEMLSENAKKNLQENDGDDNIA